MTNSRELKKNLDKNLTLKREKFRLWEMSSKLRRRNFSKSYKIKEIRIQKLSSHTLMILKDKKKLSYKSQKNWERQELICKLKKHNLSRRLSFPKIKNDSLKTSFKKPKEATTEQLRILKCRQIKWVRKEKRLEFKK